MRMRLQADYDLARKRNRTGRWPAGSEEGERRSVRSGLTGSRHGLPPPLPDRSGWPGVGCGTPRPANLVWPDPPH